jgi:hypothetical protein
MSKLLSFSALAFALAFSNTVQADEVFVGIGIVVQSEKKSIQIVDVYENSPASRAGVTPGEWITAVDGKETKGKKLKEVVTWLRGDEGTQVLLTLQTEDRQTSRDLQLTREKIIVKCFMQGQVNLNFYDSGNNNGSLNGWIDGESVYWQVSNGYINAHYGGQYFNLNFDSDMNQNIHVSGWINGTYVDWRGYNNQINASQSCIR